MYSIENCIMMCPVKTERSYLPFDSDSLQLQAPASVKE